MSEEIQKQILNELKKMNQKFDDLYFCLYTKNNFNKVDLEFERFAQSNNLGLNDGFIKKDNERRTEEE